MQALQYAETMMKLHFVLMPLHKAEKSAICVRYRLSRRQSIDFLRDEERIFARKVVLLQSFIGGHYKEVGLDKMVDESLLNLTSPTSCAVH